MITKVSKIGELYQINNSETPLDITSLRELLKESSTISNMNDWIDTLDEKGENEFELKTAEKGTVVNIYEVEYPTPSDPNKETQEMAASVDEYEDFVTQNLFPGVMPEDIIVTQREHKEDIKEGLGRLFNEKELRERGKRGSKEHWKKVLSTTKTMPSPTKTPVKIPKREVPTKDPDKINPFRKPNINPSKEPQPKALPVVYPEGSKLKMHPDLEKVINIRDTPYHGLPQVPGGEYIENISSERFKLIIKNLEKYYGKKINTLKDIAPALQMVLIRIEEIESDYIEELEQLAILLVENYFGIERGEVEFDARLVRQVTLEDISNLSSSEEKDLEKKLPSLDLSLDVSKRRFINGLIQGAGINSLSMFHLVKDELMKMNPDLIGMYGLLTSFIELGYWITSPSLSGLALSNAPGAGKVKLDLSKEKPIIVSFAINFPVLVQELVKGVMELISSHGLPEDEELRNQVLEKADTLEDESWDIRFGPEIWKKLLSHLNITELNGRALSILYYSLIQMNSADFSDFVNQILSNKREGINKWNEMYQQALQQITKTTSLHVDREEREVEGYNRYRKIALLKGEIPKLYYEWINE